MLVLDPVVDDDTQTNSMKKWRHFTILAQDIFVLITRYHGHKSTRNLFKLKFLEKPRNFSQFHITYSRRHRGRT